MLEHRKKYVIINNKNILIFRLEVVTSLNAGEGNALPINF
jgi:hypothetical protein